MKNQTLQSGVERIEKIKNKISSLKNRRSCRAEVYEVWDNIFKPENTNNEN